jgi:hypothetical protein
MKRTRVSSRKAMNSTVPNEGIRRACGDDSGLAGDEVDAPARRWATPGVARERGGDRRALPAAAGGPIVESWFGIA